MLPMPSVAPRRTCVWPPSITLGDIVTSRLDEHVVRDVAVVHDEAAVADRGVVVAGAALDDHQLAHEHVVADADGAHRPARLVLALGADDDVRVDARARADDERATQIHERPDGGALAELHVALDHCGRMNGRAHR